MSEPFFPFPWQVQARNVGNKVTITNVFPTAQNLEAAERALAEWVLRNITASDALVINAEAHGLKLDGATDDGPALNALLAQTHGELTPGTGATVYVPRNRIMALGTTVVRQPHVNIVGDDAQIRVLPALNAGPVFTNETSHTLLRSDLRGFRVDKAGLEGTLLDTHSMQESTVSFRRMIGGAQTCVNLKLLADGTEVPADGDAKVNSVFNDIYLTDNGTCGRHIVLQGTKEAKYAGGSGSPAVVTLNDFHGTDARNVYVGGIDCVEWCDNNLFHGRTSIATKGQEAFAMKQNSSATPAAEVGVYANKFDYLSSEQYGTATKRKGIVLNFSHSTEVLAFFGDPTGPEGEQVENLHSQSHYIVQVGLSGSQIVRKFETPFEQKEVAAPSQPPSGFGKLYMSGGHLFFWPGGAASPTQIV